MSSIFVNWWLWPFLAAAAVPILLHLLSLRRLPVIELSTFRFLFDTYVQQRRRIKLLEYLLLLLRTLFLLFLALAVMRPMQDKFGGLFGATGRAVALVVDNSASMGVRTAGVSSLDRAKQAATAILKKLSPADRVTLFELGARPETKVRHFAADAPELPEAIERIEPGVAAANIHAGVSAALADDRSEMPKSVYLFTDMQKTNWRQVVEQQGGKLLAGDDRLYVLNVGAKETLSNRGLVGDPPTDSECIVGQPVELRPRLANFSGASTSATVRVEVDGQEFARFAVSVPPGKITSRTATYVPTKPGPLHGRYVVERDRFEPDDEYLFCLNVAGPAKVLLVNGKPDADPFKDEMVFLRTALRSRYRDDTGGADAKGALRTLDAGSLSIEEARDGEWNRDRLQGVSLVVFANAVQFSNEQLRDLREYVDRGGGAAFFPGDRQNGQYARLFGRTGPGEGPLLPVEIEGPQGDANGRSKFERLAAVDYSHPVLTVFRPGEGKEYLASARFFRYFPLRIAREDRYCFTLARFGNNRPALVEGRYGKGIVLLAAFPVSAEWSTLPLVGSDFVPLILRLVAYAKRKPDLVVPAAVRPGAVAALSAAERLEEATATVVGPDKERTNVPLSPGSGDLGGKFEKTNAKGYYQTELSAREPAPRRREENYQQAAPRERQISVTAGFAVNAAPEESDFSPLTTDEAGSLLGEQATIVDLSGTEGDVASELTEKREIWRWLAYGLLAIFCTEFFLATLRGPRSAAELAAAAEQGSLMTRITGVKPMDKVE
ncbi:MAG TPA: VWA domain-containing protein [Planctomycetia bacterium]|nr:VWA domain-containing protein [Planctomycetia bacterium]